MYQLMMMMKNKNSKLSMEFNLSNFSYEIDLKFAYCRFVYVCGWTYEKFIIFHSFRIFPRANMKKYFFLLRCFVLWDYRKMVIMIKYSKCNVFKFLCKILYRGCNFVAFLQIERNFTVISILLTNLLIKYLVLI